MESIEILYRALQSDSRQGLVITQSPSSLPRSIGGPTLGPLRPGGATQGGGRHGLLRLAGASLPGAPTRDSCPRRRQGAEDLDIRRRDAETAILVSQHCVADRAAAHFFSEIARNLASGSRLFSADISLPDETDARERLLDAWKQQAVSAGLPEEAPESMKGRFGQDLVACPWLPNSPASVRGRSRSGR